MTTSSSRRSTIRGWGHALWSRPRAVAGLATIVVVLAVGVGYAVHALGAADGSGGSAGAVPSLPPGFGQQVLGGESRAGVVSVQRLRHDDDVFTVTIAPARPGRNLVRVDVTPASGSHGSGHEHAEHAGGDAEAVTVGTDEANLVPATSKPGTDGSWAVVDLPAGTATVLVGHGPEHRLPFTVDTGHGASSEAVWSGPDGPECLTSAVATVLAGRTTPSTCSAATLSAADREALGSVVATLARRGVEEVAVDHDSSARSRAAYTLIGSRARALGLRVVAPSARPGRRDALLEVSGWQHAAGALAAVSRLDVRRQPMRSDGTWLAPWLLSPGVVDSTAGSMIALDFDIRDGSAQEFSQTLARYLPGQAPTAAAYVAWRTARHGRADGLRLYAASRAAYMPEMSGHTHETTVSWFPGGTVTPVGSLTAG